MSFLYERGWRLKIDTIVVEALDIHFSVKRTLKRVPNTAKIDIFNLSNATRAKISNRESLNVSLEAGYKGAVGLIYFGQVRGAVSSMQQPEILTTIESGDGDSAQRSSKISVPVGPSMPIDQAFRLIARALGVKEGNISATAARVKASGRALYPVNTWIHGSAAEALDDFCRSAGIEWSIQNGGLQFVDRGKAIAQNPYILSSDSGMVGSPAIDSKGQLDVTCLLNPELRPGLPILVQARFVKGLFRITEIEYQGETDGDSWYCAIKGERIKT